MPAYCYNLPTYCYNLLIGTGIVLTGRVIMHAGSFTTIVYNDTTLAGSYILYAV